jgi:hypothetical protein
MNFAALSARTGLMCINHEIRKRKTTRTIEKNIDYFERYVIILSTESPANKWTFKKR